MSFSNHFNIFADFRMLVIYVLILLNCYFCLTLDCSHDYSERWRKNMCVLTFTDKVPLHMSLNFIKHVQCWRNNGSVLNGFESNYHENSMCYFLIPVVRRSSGLSICMIFPQKMIMKGRGVPIIIHSSMAIGRGCTSQTILLSIKWWFASDI